MRKSHFGQIHVQFEFCIITYSESDRKEQSFSFVTLDSLMGIQNSTTAWAALSFTVSTIPRIITRLSFVIQRDQESGKGAIRKRIPLQKPRWEKNQTNNQVLIP